MKTIRKDWPRVRQYVKAGNTYFSVDLRRKHYRGRQWKNFTSRDKALKYTSEVGKKVVKSGIYSIQGGQGDDRLKAWGEQCAAYGKENASVRAYFALCLFGGIRPEEAERMKWGDDVRSQGTPWKVSHSMKGQTGQTARPDTGRREALKPYGRAKVPREQGREQEC